MTTDQKFINAVYNIDLETFKALLENASFNEALLNDIEYVWAHCPIYWLTQCWEIVLNNPNEWSEEYRKTVEDNKRKNLEIKKIFETRFNVDLRPINFSSTGFEYYIEDKYATFEDIFDGNNRKDMIANGCKDLDLDLYVAASKFNFDETKSLLEKGADPTFEIPDWEYSIYERVYDRYTYFSVELQGITVEQRRYNIFDDTYGNADSFVDNLVGLAALQSMFELLYKYVPEEN